jgi:hypothetical protein
MPSLVEGVAMDVTTKIKPGWQLWRFVVPDSAVKAYLDLSNGSGAWYGLMFLPGWRGALEGLWSNVLKKYNYSAQLPTSEIVDYYKLPNKSNLRKPKWFDSKSKSFFLWVNVKAQRPSTGILDTLSIEKQIIAELDGVANSNKTKNQIRWIVYRTAIKQPASKPPVKPNPNNPATSASNLIGAIKPPIQTNPLNPISQPINAINAGISSVQQQLTAQGGGNIVPSDVEDPPKSQIAVDGWTNPWLWGVGAVFVFALAIGTKQIRGWFRDVGGGVRSVYEEGREGVDIASSDPSKGRK